MSTMPRDPESTTRLSVFPSHNEKRVRLATAERERQASTVLELWDERRRRLTVRTLARWSGLSSDRTREALTLLRSWGKVECGDTRPPMWRPT